MVMYTAAVAMKTRASRLVGVIVPEVLFTMKFPNIVVGWLVHW